MALSRVIDNYGGVFSDALPVEDPTTEISAAYHNRMAEDAAQMTRTTVRARVRFPTTTTTAPVVVTPSSGTSHMGTGSGQLPTMAKSGTGLYDITYPISFEDGLELDENIVFTYGGGRVSHLSTAGHVQVTLAANVIHVAVFNASGTLSDLGGGVAIEIEAS